MQDSSTAERPPAPKPVPALGPWLATPHPQHAGSWVVCRMVAGRDGEARPEYLRDLVHRHVSSFADSSTAAWYAQRANARAA